MGYNKSGVDPDRLDEKIAELESLKFATTIFYPTTSSQGPCNESLKLFDLDIDKHLQAMNDVFDATINYLRRIGGKLEKG